MARIIFAITVFCAVFLTACSPGAEQKFAAPEIKLAVKSENDLALVRHLLLDVADARRMMDVALNYQLEWRIFTIPDHIAAQDGCRTLVKRAPARDAKVATNTESFDLRFSKCMDPVGSDLLARAKELRARADQEKSIISGQKDGTENYQISYSKPYPRENEPEQTVGLPESLTVTAQNLRFALSYFTNSHNRLTVDRNETMNARLTEEDEKTATYTADLRVNNDFNLDWQRVYRNGWTHEQVTHLTFVVDKTSRQVSKVVFEESTLAMGGDQWDKSDDAGSSLANHTALSQLNYTLTPNSEPVVGGACEASGGQFRGLRTGGLRPLVVQSSGGHLSDGIHKMSSLAACRNDGNPSFAVDFEFLN